MNIDEWSVEKDLRLRPNVRQNLIPEDDENKKKVCIDQIILPGSTSSSINIHFILIFPYRARSGSNIEYFSGPIYEKSGKKMITKLKIFVTIIEGLFDHIAKKMPTVSLNGRKELLALLKLKQTYSCILTQHTDSVLHLTIGRYANILCKRKK